MFHCLNALPVFIRSPTGAHVGCFHLLAVVNGVATSSGVPISLQGPVLLGACPGVEVQPPMEVLCLMVEEPPCCFHGGCAYSLSH